MRVWPPPPGWPAPSRRTTRTRRVAAGVVGALLLLPGLGLLAGGGTLLWAHTLDRSDGFVDSPRDDVTSEGHALVSDRIYLAAARDWLPLPDSLGAGGIGWAALVVGSVLTVPAARLLVRGASRRPEGPAVRYRQPPWDRSTPPAPPPVSG